MIGSVSFGQTYIPFSGTGTLASNGWTTHSGTAGQQTILTTASDNGNSLSYTGLASSSGNRTSIIAGNSEDVNFPFTAPITTGPVYYSVLVKVLDAAQLNLNSSTGDYSLALTSVASASTTVFQSRIYFKQGSAANTFVVGILNNSGGTAAPSYITTDLNVNTTYLFVAKYDFTTNTASLFINPTPGGTEPTTANATNATGTTAAPTQSAGFVIRQGGNATAGTGNVEFDEVRVSTTWANVTPSSLAVSQNEIVGLQVYSNNNLLFVTSDSSSDKNVVVYDMLGKVVVNETVSSQPVNVANLSSGAYIVKVTEEGKTATKKLVIQ